MPSRPRASRCCALPVGLLCLGGRRAKELCSAPALPAGLSFTRDRGFYEASASSSDDEEDEDGEEEEEEEEPEEEVSLATGEAGARPPDQTGASWLVCEVLAINVRKECEE